MNTERDPGRDQVPLPGFTGSAAAEMQAPGFDGPASPSQARQARKMGIRRVRRMSNWTAAALIVGTGATTVALAHNVFPIGTPAATSSGTTGVVTTTSATGTTGPQVTHTVATTSASGVTTTTTSRVVNGKTVVSHARHVPAGLDR
jgi:hypothetical protein